MGQQSPGLGICFFGNQLFYAVHTPGNAGKLSHIGCVDFNFDVPDALLTGDSTHFPGIRQAVEQLRESFSVRHVRILSFPDRECWSILPKIVYDNADEREAHLAILMHGKERSDIEPTWHPLSNAQFKLLLLRDRSALGGLAKIAPDVSTVDLISEFEIGSRWIAHADPGGSFLTVCCFRDCISVSSYLLGSLRGTTWIPREDADDLPYLWLHRARELNWMQGIHDHVYVYGFNTHPVIDTLLPFWDESGPVEKMDTVEKIRIEADETTYGFALEKAFPAILLALSME